MLTSRQETRGRLGGKTKNPTASHAFPLSYVCIYICIHTYMADISHQAIGRRGSATACLLRFWVWIPPGGMSVSLLWVLRWRLKVCPTDRSVVYRVLPNVVSNELGGQGPNVLLRQRRRNVNLHGFPYPEILVAEVTQTLWSPPRQLKVTVFVCYLTTPKLYADGGRRMNECGAMVEWYWQGKTEVLGEKHYTACEVDEWMSAEQWWNDTDRGKLKYWKKNIIQRVW
jgi:hypothetical protein